MKVAPRRTMKVKRPMWRQKNMFGARIRIMWEEQLVGPPIDFIFAEGLLLHNSALQINR